MTKDFIPYEEALALKDLGFDEYCLAEYRQWDGNYPHLHLNDCDYYDHEYYDGYNYDYTKECGAPLYQQAFRWFREKYDLVIEPCVPFQRLY
jgi:hypothetical protein